MIDKCSHNCTEFFFCNKTFENRTLSIYRAVYWLNADYWYLDNLAHFVTNSQNAKCQTINWLGWYNGIHTV